MVSHANRQDPIRKVPLRDLLTEAEKLNRDLIEQMTSVWLERVGDLRELSRPIRKRSHYPTFLASSTRSRNWCRVTQEIDAMLDILEAANWKKSTNTLAANGSIGVAEKHSDFPLAAS